MRIRVTQAVCWRAISRGITRPSPAVSSRSRSRIRAPACLLTWRAGVEPFFTTKEVERAPGSACQVFGFVRQLGGHIMLDSTPGQGTRRCGTAVAPVAHRLEESGPPRRLGSEGRDGACGRDVRRHPDDRRGAAGCRARSSARSRWPIGAGNPARSGAGDVLFSDVVMPGGRRRHGPAPRAHALRPGLPVLLTSGYGGPHR